MPLLFEAFSNPHFDDLAAYQSKFYPLLDHIVLLTITVAAAIDRLASRTTNAYSKDPAELRRELDLHPAVEPLLRCSACLEIDTSIHQLSDVITMITNHVEQGIELTPRARSARPSACGGRN